MWREIWLNSSMYAGSTRILTLEKLHGLIFLKKEVGKCDLTAIDMAVLRFLAHLFPHTGSGSNGALEVVSSLESLIETLQIEFHAHGNGCEEFCVRNFMQSLGLGFDE